MSAQLFTIGHSTHSLARFIELLKQHGVEILADIRRFPGSRKFPQFNQETLPDALAEAGIEYRWFEVLGGRRRKKVGAPSENVGLRNESFRNYADYMETAEFQNGAERVLELAREKPLAYMCAEGLFWQCHRRLVSDYFFARGEATSCPPAKRNRTCSPAARRSPTAGCDTSSLSPMSHGCCFEVERPGIVGNKSSTFALR
jgi:uncharacterized protein (DUF488 family)